MGRLEKIVVLTVLFLVAVILGISLNTDDGVAGPQDQALASGPTDQGEPEEASDDDLRPTTPPAEPGTEDDPSPGGLLTTYLLKPGDENPEEESGEESLDEESTESILPGEGPATEDEAAPIEPAPVAAAPFLLTREGLTESRVEDLMIYTWQEGDSFTALSDRYYGSRLETGRLRAANEGRDESVLQPGERIFVPVRAAESRERLTRSSRDAGQWIGGSVYVVSSGDMLGSISQKVYGSASKWRKIYDANRDLLGSPDELKVGMKLRIPAVD